MAAGPLHGIRIHPQALVIGKPARNFLFQFLRPFAQKAHAAEITMRAAVGHPGPVIAIVADGLPLVFVMCQPDFALGTCDRFAAGGALDVGGKAAAVEQQDDLPTVAQRLLDRNMQLPADCPSRIAFGVCGPQVDRVDGRQRSVFHAVGQPHPQVFSPLRSIITLQRRSRGTQHQGYLFVDCALASHFASVITWSGLLFERVFVFFIDDDQSQMGCGCKDGTAGPHNHRHGSAGDLFPMPMPLDVAQVAVQYGHRAETFAEPGDGLRRQADFRHQDDRLPAVTDHFPDGVHIDFGFAAAGDTLHQDGLVPPAAQDFQDVLQGDVLLVVQFPIRLNRLVRSLQRLVTQTLHLAGDQAFAAEGRDGCGGTACGFGQLSGRHGRTLPAQNFQHGCLFFGQFQVSKSRPDCWRHRQDGGLSRTCRAPHSGRDDRFQHLSQRAEVIVGHPLCQPQHRRREEAAAVDDLEDIFQPAGCAADVLQADAVTGHAPVAAPQGNADPRPDLHFVTHRLRYHVIQYADGARGNGHLCHILFGRRIQLPRRRVRIKQTFLLSLHPRSTTHVAKAFPAHYHTLDICQL